jgi:hypothetical protein
MSRPIRFNFESTEAGVWQAALSWRWISEGTKDSNGLAWCSGIGRLTEAHFAGAVCCSGTGRVKRTDDEL